MSGRTCRLEWCPEGHYARDLCKRHYYQLRRTGRIVDAPVTHRTKVTPWRFV